MELFSENAFLKTTESIASTYLSKEPLSEIIFRCVTCFEKTDVSLHTHELFASLSNFLQRC